MTLTSRPCPYKLIKLRGTLLYLSPLRSSTLTIKQSLPMQRRGSGWWWLAEPVRQRGARGQPPPHPCPLPSPSLSGPPPGNTGSRCPSLARGPTSPAPPPPSQVSRLSQLFFYPSPSLSSLLWLAHERMLRPSPIGPPSPDSGRPRHSRSGARRVKFGEGRQGQWQDVDVAGEAGEGPCVLGVVPLMPAQKRELPLRSSPPPNIVSPSLSLTLSLVPAPQHSHSPFFPYFILFLRLRSTLT
ncbi:hypothetical protein H6P81_001346 [Aristolochia fimbriata]|uniref:Uncharacterized protein n=1 Tax=Aristolochia fimbriata TaxID=158543 RepID=A0AAV7F784_ARIFI|nr:hypothetical protein H6P81_001346 [Aristolochia fimbriata]